MPPAPTVASLSDLVGQYSSAFAPEVANLNDEEGENESSGSAQVSGLQNQEQGAFNNITNEANARGATFSGFTPNAEANYVGGTYLPALAKLQSTIATTRNTLMGDEANINSTVNTDALNENKTEQSALDTYNENAYNQQEDNQRQTESEQATAAEDAATRAEEESVASSSASAANAKDSAAELSDFASATAAQLAKETGSDGYVSPQSYAAAAKVFMSQGYNAQQFDALLGQFKNPNNKNYSI